MTLVQRSEFVPSGEAPAGRRAVWLATGLGVGLATPAPGTIGGLWGLLLVWAIAPMQPIGAQLALIALLAVLAALLCTRAAAMLEGGGDPGAIVLDEIVALPLVFVGVQRLDWLVLLVGFLLFRWFDITKPAWVRAAERLPVGWGIVADDLVAAVSACAVLHGLGWLARTFEWSWFAL